MNPRLSRSLLALALICSLAGCGSSGGKKHPYRGYRPPKPPPAAPPRQDVPVDPALQSTARQELSTAAVSNKPLIRAHAIEAMRDSIGAEAADVIIKGLTDNDAVVRFAASMAAGELRLAQAHDALLVLSDDSDPSVRVGAKFALHRIGDVRQSHDLEATARDPSPRTRGNTALALGLLGEPSGARILAPMLFDPSAAVRLQAAESLWRLGDARGLESVIASSLSKFPDDRMLAVLALAAPRDRRVLGHVQGELTDDYDEVSLIAARAAGMLGSDDGYGVALKGAHSTDPRQRLLAALALGAIGRSDSQTILSILLRDSDQDVRIAASTALLQLKPAT